MGDKTFETTARKFFESHEVNEINCIGEGNKKEEKFDLPSVYLASPKHYIELQERGPVHIYSVI